MKNATYMASDEIAIDEQQKVNRDKKNYQAFVNGDNKAFEALVIEYKDHLIYFINRFVQNITIAEDLAQDVFVDILLHKERYEYRVSFKTYLFTIGRNKAVDYIRKNQKITLVEELPEDSIQERGLENKIVRDEEQRLLYRMIACLKDDYRIAIMLIDLEGFSYAQAARILHKSDAQMKILIYRARKSLAKLMEKEVFTYEK